MKIKSIIIIVIIMTIFYFNFNIPLTMKSISGTYVNRHYDAFDAHHETAKKSDTLTLKPDGSLYSEFYGNGTYEIAYEGVTTYIDIKPENPNDVMSIYTYITNRIFEKTKINLGGEWECYEKLNDKIDN